ncbi:PepSY domain-containing protein [Streptomyces sp. NPDC052302]|uniref:PepSY domain-containing protein n=1 Tax=Streptomyces sp. NPDC052302 TaxID=3365688 RepID=UPI0037D12A09
MKRNLVLATVAAAALIGGGTVAAYAGSGDDGASPRQSDVRVAGDRDDTQKDDDDGDRRDSRDDDRGGRDDDRGGRDDDRDDRDEARSQAGRTGVTAADAIAAALERTPGTAVSAELDDDGSRVWEVTVVEGDGTEHDVRVSAGDGKVLSDRRDDDDDREGRADLAALKGASVDAREAAEAAASKGVVVEIDLDDDGPAVWKAETTKGEWNVGLKSGAVTPHHDDDRDDLDDD